MSLIIIVIAHYHNVIHLRSTGKLIGPKKFPETVQRETRQVRTVTRRRCRGYAAGFANKGDGEFESFGRAPLLSK
jgi:hypothetical protein